MTKKPAPTESRELGVDIGLLVTTRCTAACQHCCFGCTPHGDQLSGDVTMTLAEAKSYINQAITLPGGLRRLGISGGEPFLLRHDLVEIVRYGRAKGAKRITINTACYWATSRKAALWRLRPLREAGLDQLDISTDDFHTEFISLDNVRRALEVGQELGLGVSVNSVITRKTNNQQTLLAQLGDAAAGVVAHEWKCMPTGAAQQFIPLDDLFQKPGLPTEPCPAPNFIIRSDGDAYFCCSPSGWTPDLKLGNAKEEPLTVLWHRFCNRELYRTLMAEGPVAFVPAIEAAGQAYRLRPSYVNTCDLCHHILSDPVLARITRENVGQRELRRVQKIGHVLGLEAVTVGSVSANQPLQEETCVPV
jgi:MoaA/NifB/PqqE/SkfB family radical SAM enzyme